MGSIPIRKGGFMKKLTVFIFVAIVSVVGFAHADAPASAPSAAPAAAGVKVEKIAVGTAIDNKEISGEAEQFPAAVGKVYGWTRITTDAAPITVKYVWSADGQKEAEVPLEIKYPSARTWSSKNVWPCSWKLEVVDGKGAVLSSKEFTITK